MTWREEDHPRWPVGTPTHGDVGPGRFRDAENPTGWASQVAVGLPGGRQPRMKFSDLVAYSTRKDYTEERIHGGNSAYTTVRTYSDGRKLLSKQHDRDDQADNEVTAAYVGWAVGAPVPAVVMDPELEGGTLSEFIEGQTAVQVIGLAGDDSNVEAYLEREMDLAMSLDGSPWLGLFDYLIGNDDRHVGNWIITPDGGVVGIDHADWDENGDGSVSPFTGWLMDVDGNLINHPFTLAELTRVHDRLNELAEQRRVSRRVIAVMQNALSDLRSLAAE